MPYAGFNSNGVYRDVDAFDDGPFEDGPTDEEREAADELERWVEEPQGVDIEFSFPFSCGLRGALSYKMYDFPVQPLPGKSEE